MLNLLRLTSRSLLRVSGSESRQFLQGLITKDINSVDESGVIFSFLLNARGRIFADLFIYKSDDSGSAFLVETDAERLLLLERTLKLYRLRRRVEIEPAHETKVHFCAAECVASGEEGQRSFLDPRAPGFGYRILRHERPEDEPRKEPKEYLRRRLEWGIPEGYDELGDQIALNMNGDLMNGISFEKGCYIGQELVARTHHTGVVRRRVMPFRSSSDEPCQIGNLFDADKRRQGRILRSFDSLGLALVTPSLAGTTLFDASGNPLEVSQPEWWPPEEK